VTTAIRSELAWSAPVDSLHTGSLPAAELGLVVIDRHGRLLQVNAAASAMLAPEVVPGSPFAAWADGHGMRRASDGSTLGLCAAARDGREAHGIGVSIDRPGGGLLSLSLSYLPLRDAAGRVSGLVLSFHDVTLQVIEHERLLEVEERLREAHELALLSGWEWRPDTDEMIIFDAPLERGSAPLYRPTLTEMLELMSPEDREVARRELAELVAGVRDTSARRARYASDGRELWIETRSRAVRDADGRLLCVRGTSQDVTEQELARRRLGDARDFFQGTLDSLAARIAVLDERGDIVMTNRAWVEFAAAGEQSPTALGMNYLASCDEAGDANAERAAAGLRGIIAGSQADFSMEYPLRGAPRERWFLLRASRYADSHRGRVVVSHEEVTERHHAEARVATQAALLDEVDVAVVATGSDRRVSEWNAGAERLYGWTSAEAMGRDPDDFIVPPEAYGGGPAATVHPRDRSWRDELTACRKDGSTFTADVRTSVILDGDGEVAGTIGVSTDITERAAGERALLEARDYTRAVAECMGEGLFTLDDGGRLTYMNAAGEELLGWSRDELDGQVMHDALHHRHSDASEMGIEDCKILHARRDGVTIRVDDEIFCRRDGREMPVAYTASPIVTAEGARGCVVIFHDISERKAQEANMRHEVEKLAWIRRIQSAFAQDRFVLYAQPIVDLNSGEVIQRELLVRMLETDGRLVAPGLFLPIAEQYGLVSDLDRWVIERAVELAAKGSPVELNISGQSIGRPDVLEHLEHCLEQTGADPSLLVFELTETSIVADQAGARAFAERLHVIGCKLALDDFGTGYGGFTYLKQLPVDYLKIDIEFVRDLVTNAGSRHVVQAVVELARGFGLGTVAEGVEDAATYDLLRELGVDFAQGYHIARPQPLDSDE
jgi:PAS domain S-box-containing protein